MAGIANMIRDYFIRKGSGKTSDYDPETEMEMFIHTFKGFSLAVVFSDESKTSVYDKTVEKIIEKYK